MLWLETRQVQDARGKPLPYFPITALTDVFEFDAAAVVLSRSARDDCGRAPCQDCAKTGNFNGCQEF